MFSKVKIYFFILFLIELFSLFGFLIPEFAPYVFFVVLTATLFLSVEKLEYGVFILLTELFISSKGYLLAFEYEGLAISLRIAMFLVVISAWLGKIVLKWMSIENAGDLIPEFDDFRNFPKKLKQQTLAIPKSALKKGNITSYFMILFVFIAWGLINGFLRGTSFNNLFYDFNGWIYFGIIFPLFYIFKKNEGDLALSRLREELFIVFNIAVVWLSVKTLFLLYFFSHDFIGLKYEIYRWLRVTGVGEVTTMESGFSRIFFQSHIFVLIALFIFMSLWLYGYLKKEKSVKRYNFFGMALMSAVIIVSFSRSFWLGLAVGLAGYFLLLIILFRKEWRGIGLLAANIILAAVVGIFLIFIIIKFPLPLSNADFDAGLIAQRAATFSGEAGVSSRWNLLPPLMAEIKKAPVRGQGFGAEVTYISNDPRVRETAADGSYTTYAFEWGWLDIWLKLGLIGLLVYVVLLLKIFADGIKKIKITNSRRDKLLYISLLSGLVVLIVTNAFSPYLNHPLGIGYVVLIAAFFNKEKTT
ncbi:MAG: O-antigen ligase family protein [bacterium]|nr:O-antigen ligase family protein [bacterium]